MKTKFSACVLVFLFLFISSFQAVFSQASCITAATITPSTTCSNTAGNIKNATSIAPIGACGGATSANTYGVWYRFTATSSSATITVSGLGSTITGANTPYIELLTGTCGSFTSTCQSASTPLSTTTLTTGVVYYIRIYVTTNPNNSGSPNQYDFSLCVVSPPANNVCSGAVALTSANTCSNTAGTLSLATASSPVVTSGCMATPGADVWYTYVATNAYPTISLSSIGSALQAAGVTVEVYSGSCGSLTSMSCASGTSASLSLNLFTSNTSTGLIIGNTYYLRVLTPTSAPSGSNWTYNICITNVNPGTAAVQTSRSYINITKGATGGTVDPGDILEMRATFVITSNMVDSLSFIDTLYNTKGFKLVPGSISLRTNEGTVYKSFTDAYDTDAGWQYTNGLDTIVRINFGIGATNFSKGRLSNSSRPSVFGGTCIVMATYRVTVYAAYNSTINFKTGSLTYRDISNNSSNTVRFVANNLIVYQSPGLCPNAVTTNALGAENNGTFGLPSGSAPLARNRGTSPYTTYIYKPFTQADGGPGDYYYGIANNTSSRFTTTNTWAKPDGSGYRVFSQWDITGDHTGASNTANGNPACDTTLPVSTSNPCGYMLIINSAYKTDTAFTYTITNLCPNTYYELAAWFKNVCYKCGCDSTGAGSGTAGYIPTATGDSSGVKPNIAFDVNGTDYFTTGNIAYLGTTPTGSDATNRWVKRGFTYLTGSAQTSLTLTLRNNAPGGGGNDWALDDIAVATCSPNMAFSPSTTPNVCSGNSINLTDTVTSYFDNYSNYKWQKSVNGGSTWSDVTTAGTATPVLTSGQYKYVVAYSTDTLTSSDAGIKYRVVVATTASNLTSTSCAQSDTVSVTPVILTDCAPVLGINFLSFNGKIETNMSVLKWTTNKEDNVVSYLVEKSTNGQPFTPVATVQGYNKVSNFINAYSWQEPYTTGQKVLYRIKILGSKSPRTSQIIILEEGQRNRTTISVVNPFHNNLIINIQSPFAGTTKVEAIDNNGNIVLKQNYTLSAGNNRLTINQSEHLPPGLYTLRIYTADTITIKKSLKL